MTTLAAKEHKAARIRAESPTGEGIAEGEAPPLSPEEPSEEERIRHILGVLHKSINLIDPDATATSAERLMSQKAAQEKATTALTSLRELLTENHGGLPVPSTLRNFLGNLYGQESTLRRQFERLIVEYDGLTSPSLASPRTIKRLQDAVESMTGPPLQHLLAAPSYGALFWQGLRLPSVAPLKCRIEECVTRCARQLQVEYMASLDDGTLQDKTHRVEALDTRILPEAMVAMLVSARLGRGKAVVVIASPSAKIPICPQTLELMFGAAPDVFAVSGESGRCPYTALVKPFTDIEHADRALNGLPDPNSARCTVSARDLPARIAEKDRPLAVLDMNMSSDVDARPWRLMIQHDRMSSAAVHGWREPLHAEEPGLFHGSTLAGQSNSFKLMCFSGKASTPITGSSHGACCTITATADTVLFVTVIRLSQTERMGVKKLGTQLKRIHDLARAGEFHELRNFTRACTVVLRPGYSL
jgi:hypothetical protein